MSCRHAESHERISVERVLAKMPSRHDVILSVPGGTWGFIV